jgi:hypothetical protein
MWFIVVLDNNGDKLHIISMVNTYCWLYIQKHVLESVEGDRLWGTVGCWRWWSTVQCATGEQDRSLYVAVLSSMWEIVMDSQCWTAVECCLGVQNSTLSSKLLKDDYTLRYCFSVPRELWTKLNCSCEYLWVIKNHHEYNPCLIVTILKLTNCSS